MNQITKARSQLAAAISSALAGKVKVFDHVPATARPPLCVLSPADDWIKPDDTFGNELLLAQRVHLIAGVGTNDQALNQLEDLIHKTITALPAEWFWDRIEAPAITDLNGSLFLTTTFTVSTIIQGE